MKTIKKNGLIARITSNGIELGTIDIYNNFDIICEVIRDEDFTPRIIMYVEDDEIKNKDELTILSEMISEGNKH